MSVRLLVHRSIGPSVGDAFVLVGRDETANDLFHVYELVSLALWFIVVSHNTIKGCVRPSVGPLVRWSVNPSVGNAFVWAGRDETANNLFRVCTLVYRREP